MMYKTLIALSLFLSGCPAPNSYNIQPDKKFPFNQMLSYPVVFRVNCNFKIADGLEMTIENQSEEIIKITKDDFIFIVEDESSKNFNARKWIFSKQDKLSAAKAGNPSFSSTGYNDNDKTLELAKDEYALLKFELPSLVLKDKDYSIQLQKPKSTSVLFKVRCNNH